MQDLVYKNGQAGVTKATVTINFDNSKKGQCPMGYENCKEISIARQIVVGGKTKYLINGKNAQQKQIQDLFCSIQLNINNPNFLIMQGQITKVLNMKPPEILSMIEEACGTSMYENKKEKSMSLIQKKDNRLDELKALIKDEIQPKLEKLRKDQQQYQEYQKVCREIEYLTRIHISFKYLQCLKAVESSEKNIQKLAEGIDKNRETIEKHINEVKEIDEAVQSMQSAIDEVSYKIALAWPPNWVVHAHKSPGLKFIYFSFFFYLLQNSGGELKELEGELEQLNQKDAKVKAAANAAQEQVTSEERNLKDLQKNIKVDENALAKKEHQMQQVQKHRRVVFTKFYSFRNLDRRTL